MEPWLRLARSTMVICAVALLAGCRGAQQTLPGSTPPLTTNARAATGQGVENVIVVIQEHRSFDNIFAGFPNADAPTTGLESTGQRVPLQRISLRHSACVGFGTEQFYFDIIYDGGKMDGWNLVDSGDPLCPYTRVDRNETKPYWDLATRYAIGDRMFASTRFSGFVNDLYLVAGTTKIAPATYAIGTVPTAWGCYSEAGTTTTVLKHGRFERGKGPFPCFTQFPTMANLLDAAGVSWKCYFGVRNVREYDNPYSYVKYVADGGDWNRNMSSPATNILADVAQGKLPAVSWVFSPLKDSDAAGFSGGPKWIASIASAVRKSAYWPHAAIVVVWEDSGNGNYYDDAAPRQISAMGLGFRVPVLVISPFARRHYVSHTDYQFGSVLKFIEERWKLGSLHSTDERSHSIGDMFD